MNMWPKLDKLDTWKYLFFTTTASGKSISGWTYHLLPLGFKDTIAEKLFPRDGPLGHKPIQTYGDGNCLYRAMSRILCGDENMHVELRVRTFIELCINKGQYLSDTFLKELTGLDGCIDNLFNSSFDTSSSVKNKDRSERYREAFEAGILDTIKPSKYSNMWHILAHSKTYAQMTADGKPPNIKKEASCLTTSEAERMSAKNQSTPSTGKGQKSDQVEREKRCRRRRET